MKQTVSKAQLAAELGCPRASITRLCQAGMPVLAGGLLDRPVTLQYLATKTCGAGGGWLAGQRGKPDLASRARALLAGKPVRKGKPAWKAPKPERESARLLMDCIRGQAAIRLPLLARELGLPERVSQQTADLFDLLLAGCGVDDLLPDYEWPAFAGSAAMSPETEARADELWSRLAAIFDRLAVKEAGGGEPVAAGAEGGGQPAEPGPPAL